MDRARAIVISGWFLAGCAATEPPTTAVIAVVAPSPAAAEASSPARDEGVVDAIGPLRIGQDFAATRAAFGPETQIETYAQESAGLEEDGYPLNVTATSSS